MKSLFLKISAIIVAGIAIVSCDTMASDSNRSFEVTITNISHGEFFTPIMVTSHQRGVKLFTLGDPASVELEDVAESGTTGPLAASLQASGKVLDIANATGPLPPGKSVTLTVKTNKRNSYVSVVSMLVPSNDAFFAVNGVRIGKHGGTLYSPAYDAGSEINDELCVSIPGPGFVCSGEGTNTATGEGYVHVHNGIQGIADLNKAQFDWRNPVAKITVKRISSDDDE